VTGRRRQGGKKKAEKPAKEAAAEEDLTDPTLKGEKKGPWRPHPNRRPCARRAQCVRGAGACRPEPSDAVGVPPQVCGELVVRVVGEDGPVQAGIRTRPPPQPCACRPSPLTAPRSVCACMCACVCAAHRAATCPSGKSL
jgi:hypothetical protein